MPPQAYRIAGDHSDPEPPGCVGLFMFGVLCVLIGGICMWLWLHAAGVF